MMELLGALEGILFVVGSEGINSDKIKEILEINDDELATLLDELKEKYKSTDSGISIEIIANKYKLVTKKEHRKYYEKLVESEKDECLSSSALETLAVIAYNCPITRSKIDEVRGLDSSYQLRKLIYRNLVKEVGRSEQPGRPFLYSVTDDFLDYLGLSSTDQLPKIDEVEKEVDSISDLYMSKYKEG